MMKKRIRMFIAFFVFLCIMQISVLQVRADMVWRTTESGTYKSSEKKEGIVDEFYDAEEGIYQFHPIIYNENNEYLPEYMGGTMYATLDGTVKVPLYWSKEPYKNKNGEKQYMGVLKPQEEQGWSENTCVIWKPKYLAEEFQIYVTSSEDGPRDLKLEYSLDGGETYAPMPEGRVSLKQGGQEQNIFENIHISKEKLGEIWRAIRTQQCYIRISPASDTKLDGSTGLYGSQDGELVLSEFSSHEWVFMCVYPIQPSRVEELSVYKTGDTKVKISWKSTGSRPKKYIIYQKKLSLKSDNNFKKIRTIKIKDNGKSDKKYSFTIKNLSKKGKYIFYVKAFNDEERSSISEKILIDMEKELLPKDIKLAKKIVVKKGESKKIPFTYKKGTKKSCVSEVQCTVGKKKIAVIKKGKIVAKKRGSTDLKVKVILKSGLQKTFKTKVVVK